METSIDMIKNYYGPDEKVQWDGRPQPFKVKSGSYSKPITTRYVACLAAMIVLLVAYILAANATSVKVGAVGLILCIGIPGFIAIDPFLNKRRMLKNSKYSITDKRVYVQIDAKNVRAIDLDDISNIQYIGGENGCGHIIISTDPGQVVKETSLRQLALSPKLVDDAATLEPFMKVKTLVLYNISNPENAMGVLHSKAA